MTIKQVRDLHAAQDRAAPYCAGCDVGFAGEQPDWPCRTATLVYTPDEIDVVVTVANALIAARLRGVKRRPSGSAT